MKISYAITVCDEAVEIQRLVNFLLTHKRVEDQIVVLFDESKNCTAVEEYLRSHSINGEFSWHKGKFEGHFADWKNKLTSFCTGDYVFQIDADEIPNLYLIQQLPIILETNFVEVDVLLVPRINTVEGLTPQHIQKWGWNVNDKGWINYPDYQWRIYRRDGSIRWKNKVHEVLEGQMHYSTLPMDEEYCLYHDKQIERQEKQNNYYNTL
jgi:hypothetical protein